jgi:heptosyltransferase-2
MTDARLFRRWPKRALELVMRPFVHRPRRTLAEIQAAQPRRILIVRQHNQMGDMLCAVPALRAVRETFPAAATMLITAPVNDGVVRGNPYLDEILLFDKQEVRSSPVRAWRFLRRMRGFAPDLAIVLNTVSFSGTSAWLAFFSGARHIIGGDSTPFGWSFSRWLYNLEMPAEPDVAGHAIDHGLRPLEAVGIRTDDRSTVIVPGPEAEAAARRFLSSLPAGPAFAIHAGAGKAQNRWPADRFAQVVRRAQQWGLSPYLIEGPADGPATEATLRALGRDAPVLRGVDLRTVAAALAASRLALVNDTGVMHVAGAVGVRALALFGPTRAESWKPPSPKVASLQSPNGRMDGIEVDAVLQWLREAMPSSASAS